MIDVILCWSAAAAVSYLMWWQNRQHRRLLAAHNHVCLVTACLLQTHGQTLPGGKRILTAPVEAMPEGTSMELHTMTAMYGTERHVGLFIVVTDDQPRERKRAIEPVRLDPDVQAALA